MSFSVIRRAGLFFTENSILILKFVQKIEQQKRSRPAHFFPNLLYSSASLTFVNLFYDFIDNYSVHHLQSCVSVFSLETLTVLKEILSIA